MSSHRVIHHFAIACVAPALGGCWFHAFSPPARIVMLDNAQPLEQGRTAVAVEGGVGTLVGAEIVAYGSLRVRHGFGASLEGSVDLSGAYVDGGMVECESWQVDCVSGHAEGSGASVRVGAKWAPWGRHFALTGGLGGGASSFGGHLAPDVGFVVSYDNRYVIPFVTASVGMSIPVAPRTLHYGEDVDAAGLTLVASTSAGVRVPLGAEDAPLRGALLAGFGALVLADEESYNVSMLGSLGGELSF